MEESEKRRERLKAMRMEAAQADVDTDHGAMRNASQSLSNPMISESETASTTSTQRRFDYYTDPMSAFSGSRNWNNTSPHNSQGPYYTSTPRMPPPPPYRAATMNSPSQRIFQAPPHHNQTPFQPGFNPVNRPDFNFQSSSNNIPRGGIYTNPRFGQGNFPNPSSGRGRGQNYNYNPPHNHGQGRGGTRSSPGSGPSVRSRSGSHNSVSAEIRPDLYYMKEMMEDPWKHLTPVLWSTAIRGSDSDKSWFPKSISVKKAKVALEEGSQRTITRENLAEFLAASFDDSIDEDVDNEREI